MEGAIEFCGLSQREDGSQSPHLIMSVIGKQPWENTPRDNKKNEKTLKSKAVMIAKWR